MGSHTQLELHGGVVNADDYVMSIELRNHGAILCARAFTLDEVSRPQTLELWGAHEAPPDCIAAAWPSIRKTHHQGTRFRWSSALELSLNMFATHIPSGRTVKLVRAALNPHFRDLLQPRHMTHPGEPASTAPDREMLVSSAPMYTRLLASTTAANIGRRHGQYWLALDGALDLHPRDARDAHLLQPAGGVASGGSGFASCGAGRLSLWISSFVRPHGNLDLGPSELETYLVRAQSDASLRVRGTDAPPSVLAEYLAAVLRLHRAPPERAQLAPWAIGEALFCS